MLSAAAKYKDIKSPGNDAEELKQTPRKREEPASSTPRLANKTPTSPRAKTGMAKELEMAFVDASVRNRSLPLAGTSSDADGRSELLARSSSEKSPRVKSIRKNESAAMKSPAILSPYRKPLPDPSRPAPLPPRKIPPLKIPAAMTDTPPSTPLKEASPRKTAQRVSEKLGSTKKALETLGSPRDDVAEIFDGIEWQEFSEIDSDSSTRNLQPPLSRAPLAEPSLKRKPEFDIERDKKKVRFNDAVAMKTFMKSHPEPAQKPPPSSSLAAEFDRLNRELVLSPVQLQRTGDGNTGPMRSIGQDAPPQFRSPIHLNLPRTEAQSPQLRAATDGTASPFPLNKLAKHASEARRQHKQWIGKASGDSIAGRLQATLEKLLAANARKVDLSVYLCLQQLFGLLPAGAVEEGRTFRYALEQSVLNLGLSVGEWSDIDKLYLQFDELDVRTFPEDGAAFRKQLGMIISTKNELLGATEPRRKKSAKDSDS